MIFGRVLVVLVAAEASGRRVRFSGRVVNGEDANIADFPFYGALAPKRSMFLDREKTHLAISCGSSLISPHYFITAYHCFLRHSDPMYWVILMGVRDRCNYDGKATVMEVSWIYKHPEAKIDNNMKMNDIALLLVIKPVTDVAPLALPLQPPHVNEKGYIIGFGLARITSPGGDIKDMACKPQKALQYVPEQSACLKPKETIVGAFCIKDVNNRQAAACRGDSGGPYLVLRNGKRTLLGLSSFGDRLCKPSSNSDHFTNVHNYVEWINKMMHEPLPEGFKRLQQNILQFEPTGQVVSSVAGYEAEGRYRYVNQVNGSNVLGVVSNGRRNVNDNAVTRYGYAKPVMAVSHTYRQPVLLVNAIDASGPGPKPLKDVSGNPRSSVVIVENPQPEGSMQQFQTQYVQQQAGRTSPGNWAAMVNRAPANPIVMQNAASWYSPRAEMPDNRVPSQNNIVPYNTVMMPQRSFTENGAQTVHYGMGPNNLPHLGYPQSQYPALTRTAGHIQYPAFAGTFFGYA